jgi:hypothetical protein
MRVTRQIVQHVLRSAERFPHIDHPFVLMQRVRESRKRTRLRQPRQGSVKCELVPAEQAFQGLNELSAEHFAEHVFWQEEASALRPNPAGAAGGESLKGESPGRHDTMDVRVMHERLSPVCSTPRKPISAPRRLGLAATSSSVSATQWNSRS